MKEPARPRRTYPGVVGESPAIRRMLASVDRLIDLADPVLLEGETGTGKGLLARAIHALGPRAAAPFVPVNCGAITETLLEAELFGSVRGAYTGADSDRPGLFEAADRGVLFLDEVSVMSPSMQKKLLRTLDDQMIRRVGAMEEIPVDVRIVAATNEPLKDRVAQGEFRKDLYYRIGAFPIRVPPLRERREDIVPLATHFLGEWVRENEAPPRTLNPEVHPILEGYPWPGNIRELRNEMRRMAVIAGPELTPRDLAPQIRDHAPDVGRTRGDYRKRLDDFERRILQEALDDHGGNLQATARAMGMDRNTLKRRLAKHGLR